MSDGNEPKKPESYDRSYLKKHILKNNIWAQDLRKNRIRQQALAMLVRMIIADAALFLAGTFGMVSCPVWLRVILYIIAGLEIFTGVVRLCTAFTWGYQSEILRTILTDSQKDPADVIYDIAKTSASLESSICGMHIDENYIFFSGDVSDVALKPSDLAWAYPEKTRRFFIGPIKHYVVIRDAYGERNNLSLSSEDEVSSLLNYLGKNFNIPTTYSRKLEAKYDAEPETFHDRWEIYCLDNRFDF